MKRSLVSALHRLPRPLRRALRQIPGADRWRRSMLGRPRRGLARPGELRPVVYLPTWLTWEGMRQRPQYLLAEFARAGHQVYFVDPRETVPRLVDGVTIVPSLSEVPGDQPLLYIHFAPVASMLRLFRNPVIVYDILDDLSIYDPDEAGVPEERRVRAHHPAMMSRADTVIASSPVLVARHRHEREDILLVENGVDVARFRAPWARPVDIPQGRPVIGYHGAIASWFDFDLFATVAERNPDWSFLLVGPVLAGVEDQAARVAAIPNVTLLGERPSDAIAAYVQAFDVGTIWFVVDRLTEAVSPLKMFEYLAAGKPVVATPLPACVAVPEVTTAASAEEWSAALASSLASSDLVALRAAGDRAAWSSRVQPLLQRLDENGRRRVSV